jgi:predicted lipoprotein with Yx(FWY)xxD motif
VNKGVLLARVGAVTIMATVALVVSACGSSNGSTATSPTQSAAAPARVGAATVGSLGAVLTGTNGRTLYYLTTESSSAIACTGACASAWPPLLVAKGTAVAHATGVTGALAMVERPDGTTQVTYDGHPVYYYSGDTTTGQAHGQGVHGTWFVLTAASAAGRGASTTPTPAGFGASANGY